MTADNVGLTQNGDPLGHKPKPPTRRRAKMKKAPLPPCLPSQQTNGTIQNCKQMASSHPGDDCAINELLEGTMDLEVVLPDTRRVRMTIERRMPMMDLLVQATTANKISPGGHVITLSPEGDKDNLHYKPNTPIGSLDTNIVYIMSKSTISDPPAKKMSRTQLQPFEPTFRLQVNLPRNQLMVMRVSPKTTLAEIKKMVCMEKGFESTRYHLVHPTQPNYLVDLNCKLSDYGGTEISLMSDLSVSASIRNSTSDLIGYSGGDDDKKRKKLLGIFKRKSKSVNNMMIAGEAFRDTSSSRGVSPARSDICDTHSLRAKRQSTKKRAPPPPPPPLPVEQHSSNESSNASEIPVVVTSTTTATTVTTTMVSHSRQSSDSSGYHEASVLSDCPDNLSPETSSGCASSGVGVTDSPVQRDISAKHNSRTPTREKPNFSSVAHSTMLIISTSKKRRAPPPPPLNSNKDSEKIKSDVDCTSKKDHSPTPVNEPTILSNSINSKVTANLSSNQPASPDYLSRSPVLSESSASCSPITSSFGNNIVSPESSPVSSPCLPADPAIDDETPNGNITINHCHTEEETGEVIHLLEKGANICDNSSIIEDELLHEFIPPPLEFATPIPSSDYNDCNEKIPPLLVHTNSNFQDPAKMKSTPTPQPRLTCKTSSQQNKTCRRTLNFSDITDQKSKHVLDQSVSVRLDTVSSEHPTIESQDITEVTADRRIWNNDQLNNEQLFEKDENSTKMLPLDDETFCTEEEYVAVSEVEWDFNIPEPPSPFRNTVDNFQPLVASENVIEKEESSKDSDDLVECTTELLDEKQSTSSNDEALDVFREKSLSICSTESSAPPLPSSCPPREKAYRAGSESSDVAPPLPISEPPLPSCPESSSYVTNAELSLSPNHNAHNDIVSPNSINNYASELLVNETKNQKVDSTSHTDNEHETGESTLNHMFVTVSQPRPRAHLQNFTIGSYKNEINTEIISWTSPDNQYDKSVTLADGIDKNKATSQKHENYSSKSSVSKHECIPISFKNKKMPKENSQWENYAIKNEVPTRVSSTQNPVHDHMTEKVQSPYSLQNDEPTKIEEERLQEEYRKLQNQLVAWQQQLLKNQTLLQQKQIVPEMNVPVISSISTKLEHTEEQTPVYRSQTLPRSKATKEVNETMTNSSTMEYHSSAKSQVLTNVTIGSWKSRSTDVITSSPVTDMKPKFQTLAPIISLPRTNGAIVVNKRRDNNSSLNSEITSGKSPQISATFDIKPLQRYTEESSESFAIEKTDSHPALILAQIRNEIKANSRHPAGISVSTSDTNFDSSRSEINSEKQSTKVCIKSKPNITYSYFGNPSVNSRSTGQTLVSHTNKQSSETIKNDSSGTKPIVIATIKSKNSWGTPSTEDKDSNMSMLRFAQVPPSPPPILPPATVPTTKGNNKLSDSQIKISRTESSSDPREELMIEIRKFGGRTALRKVPLNQAGWHLKVFGTLSSTPV